MFCLMIMLYLSGSSWTFCRKIVFLVINWKFVVLANGDFSVDCWILSHCKLGAFQTLLTSLITSTNTEKGGDVTLLFPLIIYSMVCSRPMNSVGLFFLGQVGSLQGNQSMIVLHTFHLKSQFLSTKYHIIHGICYCRCSLTFVRWAVFVWLRILPFRVNHISHLGATKLFVILESGY